MNKLPKEWFMVPASSIVVGLTRDADFSDPSPGEHLTSAQVWGRLLRMSSEERMKFLDMTHEAVTRGSICQLHGHEELLRSAEVAHQNAILNRVAATTQQAEAEEWHNRFKRVLSLAHGWRQAARDFMVDRDMRAAGVEGGEEPDLVTALLTSLEKAREDTDKPCSKCGGDRLRADFTTSGRCHAPFPNDDVRCPNDNELVNVRCWKCGWRRSG